MNSCHNQMPIDMWHDDDSVYYKIIILQEIERGAALTIRGAINSPSHGEKRLPLRGRRRPTLIISRESDLP
jgi:hypothetical protein